MNLKKRLDDALHIIREAGNFIQSAQHAVKIEHKTENDYVTQVDRENERRIRDALASLYPEDSFLGEEYGTVGSAQGQWILDPIDGTTNYMRGLEEYCISLAYAQNQKPLLGIVYAPAMNKLYYAISGGGAYRDGNIIHVSAENHLRDTVVGMAFAHRNPNAAPKMQCLIRDLMREAGDMRRSGSAAIDLCRVAEGGYGAYVEPYLNLYDIAAGVLIVREAGGTVTGFPHEADAWETGNVLASNGLLHEAMEKWIDRACQD